MITIINQFILFLAAYGVDSVLTIIHRLIKRENIFEAHRSHLYQYTWNPGEPDADQGYYLPASERVITGFKMGYVITILQ